MSRFSFACVFSDYRETKLSLSVDQITGCQRIGSKNFIAILDDNATAAAFKALLPMTVEMTELNGNEKYAPLSGNLPTKNANPGTIQTGDLMMIYGSKTVVLFYKTFPTSYEYTRLGRVRDTTGLAEVVGSGSVTVAFAHD